MKTIEKQINDLTIVFVKKENEILYSFYIKNEKELTEKVLAHVRAKKVKESSIEFASIAIYDLIKNNELTPIIKGENSPYVKLQRLREAKKIDFDEEFTTIPKGIMYCIYTIGRPNRLVFTGTGSNKLIARQEAASKALNFLNL